MSQDHCRMHQVFCYMPQSAITGTAGAGATGVPAGGATVGRTAGGLGTGLTTLRKVLFLLLGRRVFCL